MKNVQHASEIHNLHQICGISGCGLKKTRKRHITLTVLSFELLATDARVSARRLNNKSAILARINYKER